MRPLSSIQAFLEASMLILGEGNVLALLGSRGLNYHKVFGTLRRCFGGTLTLDVEGYKGTIMDSLATHPQVLDLEAL